MRIYLAFAFLVAMIAAAMGYVHNPTTGFLWIKAGESYLLTNRVSGPSGERLRLR